MKRNFLKVILNLSLVLLAFSLVFTSCKDDDDDDPKPLVEDGAYIKGVATPYTALDIKGMMVDGINEDGGKKRTGMYEKYMIVDANAAGFNVIIKAGSVETTYGPATNESVNLKGLREQPDETVQRGTLGATGVFTVPEKGLYHFVIDLKSNTYVIIPVKHWCVLGGSPQGVASWSDIDINLKGTVTESAEFEITNQEMRKGEFKFRHGGGWKIHMDTVAGVKVDSAYRINTNFGGEVSGTLPNLEVTLVPGGPNYNMVLTQEGKYTLNLKWTADAGWKVKITKTADVVIVDPAIFLWSLIGNAFNNQSGVPAAWDYDKDFTYFETAGDVYKYKIENIEMLTDGSFKVRKDHAWGTNYGWGITIEGDPTNFVADGENIKVVAGKTYTSIVFELNWASDAAKLVFTPAK